MAIELSQLYLTVIENGNNETTNANGTYDSYIYPLTINPISGTTSTSLNGTPGCWYYYSSSNSIINGVPNSDINGATYKISSTTSQSSGNSYTISFNPGQVLPAISGITTYMYIAGQGGQYGTNGSTAYASFDYNIAYGGGGGGGGGGQVNTSAFTVNGSNTLTITLYPRGTTTVSSYTYNDTTVSVGFGNSGTGGSNGKVGSYTYESWGGSGGFGGSGGSGGSGGNGTYYGGGGGNGGYGGWTYVEQVNGAGSIMGYTGQMNQGSEGPSGLANTSSTSTGGTNGQSGGAYKSSPGLTTVIFADTTSAKVCSGGIGGYSTTYNTSYLATAGNNPEFMFYFFVPS